MEYMLLLGEFYSNSRNNPEGWLNIHDKSMCDSLQAEKLTITCFKVGETFTDNEYVASVNWIELREASRNACNNKWKVLLGVNDDKNN